MANYCRSCCKIVTVSLVPVTVLLLSLAFFVGFVSLPVLYATLSYNEQFGVVIDAGSSHTQVFLYTWKLPFFNNTGQVHENAHCLIPGGISTYSNATEAANSIHGCVKNVLERIPEPVRNSKEHPNNYVWFGATGGMRLLEQENKNLSDEILDKVKENIEELGSTSDVGILSGKEEALYGWISSNYINGTFRKKLPKRERSLQKSTMGALDMGGASMQIAFTHDGPIDNDYTLMADLFGDSYNVYSRSYLCYGVNEAVRRILAYSLMEAGINAQNISNPCLHTGDSMNYSSDSHYFNKQPCIEDVIPSGSLPNRTYMFIGTSDYTACQTLVAKAMNFSTELPGGSTIEYSPPNAKGRFYGFSNFYHTVDFFDVANLTMNNFEIFKSNVTDHCSQTWKQVRENHDNTPTYLSRYCMEGTFVTYVLSDGFGFNSSNPDWSVHFTNKVDGLFVGWSLGYMLNQTNSITSDIHNVVYPYTLVDLVVGMIVLTILCLIFVVFFFFTFSACVKSLRPVANGYTNIA